MDHRSPSPPPPTSTDPMDGGGSGIITPFQGMKKRLSSKRFADREGSHSLEPAVDLATEMEAAVMADLAVAASTPARFRPSMLFVESEDHNQLGQQDGDDASGLSNMGGSHRGGFFANFNSTRALLQSMVLEESTAESQDHDQDTERGSSSSGDMKIVLDQTTTPRSKSPSSPRQSRVPSFVGNDADARSITITEDLGTTAPSTPLATAAGGDHQMAEAGMTKTTRKHRNHRDTRNMTRRPKGLLVLELQRDGHRDFKTMGAAELVRYIQGSVRRVNNNCHDAVTYSGPACREASDSQVRQENLMADTPIPW